MKMIQLTTDVAHVEDWKIHSDDDMEIYKDVENV